MTIPIVNPLVTFPTLPTFRHCAFLSLSLKVELAQLLGLSLFMIITLSMHRAGKGSLRGSSESTEGQEGC